MVASWLEDLLRPVAGGISSPFGPRVAPLPGASSVHKGVDYRAPLGTAVRSAASGVVSFAGVQGGYGNLVIVTHPGGAQTYYAHLSRLDVAPGQSVAAGQTIAASGASGNVTGPHLHFEVRLDGAAVDPEPLLRGGAVSVVDAPVIDWASLPDFSAVDLVDDVVDAGDVDEFGMPTFSVDAFGRIGRELGAAAGVDESAMWVLLALVGLGIAWSLSPARPPAAVPVWE